MAFKDTSFDPSLSLLEIPATSRHRRALFAVALALLVVFAITAPFADKPLPAFVSFNPSVESMVLVNDLVTSILLFSQYSIRPLRAILALAAGYLYTALIIIPHILTLPGAFPGLLDAGAQSSAWLYYLWNAGTPVAAIAYAILGTSEGHANQSARTAAIGWTVVLVIVLVLALTWLVTGESRLLPQLMAGDHYTNAVRYVASPLTVLINAAAITLLWSRRRSVLDYWLMLVLFALILQHVYGGYLATGRYSLGFYMSRGFTLATSILLLWLLLQEMTNLYARVARSNMMLERERNNKLMSLEAMAASISHELRQPLSAIKLNSATALSLLDNERPDLNEARSVLNDIVEGGDRADHMLQSIRALFGRPEQVHGLLDLNETALEALRILRGQLNEHRVTTRVNLGKGLPLVTGHEDQMREVVLNLIHNAVEAMGTVSERARVLELTTRRCEPDSIALALRDTGTGINSRKLDEIFDAFFTTKPQGMGLGLAICQIIVERHGGRLTAYSDGKTGALFQLLLPITGPGASADKEPT